MTCPGIPEVYCTFLGLMAAYLLQTLHLYGRALSQQVTTCREGPIIGRTSNRWTASEGGLQGLYTDILSSKDVCWEECPDCGPAHIDNRMRKVRKRISIVFIFMTGASTTRHPNTLWVGVLKPQASHKARLFSGFQKGRSSPDMTGGWRLDVHLDVPGS